MPPFFQFQTINAMQREILEQPIGYDEACAHLRVDEGTDTIQISRLIAAATRLAENYIETFIAKSRYTLQRSIKDSSEVVFQAFNLLEIESIELDETGVLEWQLVSNGDRHTIHFNEPLTGDLEVVFKAGFSPETCDESIRTAILLKIGELYDVDRSGYTLSNYRKTDQFQTILNHHKQIYFR